MLMKTMTLIRTLMAVAMLFAVQTSANAQLGGLLKKAKNAAEKTVKGVVNGTSSGNVGAEALTNVQIENAREEHLRNSPQAREYANVEKAGGWDKYLELDKTANGQILYKYFALGEGGYEAEDKYSKENGYDISCVRNATGAARTLVQVIRWMKGNTETYGEYGRPEYALDKFNNSVPEALKRASQATRGKKPISQAELQALTAENTRLKELYKAGTGVREKTADELKAEAQEGYVMNIINANYLLDNLSDKNRNAKAVADYKTKVNAKVKAQLAPTKILGTYSTSVAWQGLPLFQYPELKDKYSSVQEMQFKTFYEKGGKYYVVKSAFRQSIDKDDNIHGAQPQKDYWPGLETPVEIPADKIQGKF